MYGVWVLKCVHYVDLEIALAEMYRKGRKTHAMWSRCPCFRAQKQRNSGPSLGRSFVLQVDIVAFTYSQAALVQCVAENEDSNTAAVSGPLEYIVILFVCELQT